MIFENVAIEEQVNSHGEMTYEEEGMFRRMRQVFQYQKSKELLEQYNSTSYELLEEIKVEKEMTISELESLSKTDTVITHVSWFLSTSYSTSEPEPSSTDSEVYQIYSTESSDEDVIQNDCLYCAKPSSFSNDKIDIEHSNKNEQQNEPSNIEVPNDESDNPLDNILLQACILDINEKPMTAFVSQIANQMLPHLFIESEVAVIRHFIRYRIHTTIDEINERLAELSRQQEAIITAMQNEQDNSDESDTESNNSSSLSTPTSITTPSPPSEEVHSEQVTSELSISPSQQNDLIEESTETQFEDIPENEPSERRTHLISHNTIASKVQKIVTANESSGNDSITLNEEYGESRGRTVKVLEIINEMVGLSSNERHNILKLRKNKLSNAEYNALLDFMESAEDLSYSRQSFWQKLLTRLHFRHAKRKKREESKNSLKPRWFRKWC